MTRRSAAPLVLALATLALTVSLATGCATSGGGQPTKATSADAASSANSSANLALMGLTQKRSQIASDFPIEVPVAAGVVKKGQSQGDLSWDYVVRLTADPTAVASWYTTAYQRAEWQIVGDDQLAGGGRRLSFKKNDAESLITVESSAGGTLVTGSIGIGASVLQTQ